MKDKAVPRYNKISAQKHMHKKLLLMLGILICLVTALCGCRARYEDYARTSTLMGTIFTASFRVEGNEAGNQMWDDIINEGCALEQERFSWRIDTSEIARINASAGSPDGYPISEELENSLNILLELSRQSDGAFDVTIGSLTKLWKIDDKAGSVFSEDDLGAIPSSEEIDAALVGCGYEKISIRDHRIYMPEEMALDFGAVGKGALLSSINKLAENRVEYGVFSAGGSVLTYGRKDSGNPWKIGIVDPFDTTKSVNELSLPGSYYIATSGDYERFFEYGGKKYHHILDPKTGYPAQSNVKSVTILLPVYDSNSEYIDDSEYSSNGILSDALSTAVFVLGADDGIELANKYQAEALIVKEDGSVVCTEGMKKYINQ